MMTPTQSPAGPHCSGANYNFVDLPDALQAALSIASYYDIHLSPTDEDLDRRLCLLNLGVVSSEEVLWPALLYETKKDLMAQHVDDGPRASEHRGRLNLVANRLIRNTPGVSSSNSSFVYLLGKTTVEESLRVFGSDVVKIGQGLLFEFTDLHQFWFGKAVLMSDVQLITAFNVVCAKRGCLLPTLKKNVKYLTAYREQCVATYRRLSASTSAGVNDSNMNTPTVSLAGDETSFFSPTSINADTVGYQPSVLVRDEARRVSASPDTLARQSPSSRTSTVVSDVRSGCSSLQDTGLNVSQLDFPNGCDHIGILEPHCEEDMEQAPIRDLLLALPKAKYGLSLPRCFIDISSLQTLSPGQSLDKQVVNVFILKVLKPKLSKDPDVYILHSDFMSKMLRLGPDGLSKPSVDRVSYESVKNWDRTLRRDGKILGMRVIFVPIEYQTSRWLFLFAHLPTLTIQLFDPRGVKPENKIFMTAMRMYLKTKMCEYGRFNPPDDWWELTDGSDTVPTLFNDAESGLFVLVNITLLSQGVELTKETYSERSLQQNQTRERIAFLLWRNSTNKPYPDVDDPSTRQSVSPVSLTSSEKKHIWGSLFIEALPEHSICAICANLVAGATQMGCCRAVCCASCLPVDRHCPLCFKRGSHSGAVSRQDVDASLMEAKVNCINNCGWVGKLQTLSAHYGMCRSDFYTSTPVKNYGFTDSRLKSVFTQAKQLDLGFVLSFRRAQATELLKDQGRRMFLVAVTLASQYYQSFLPEANSRTSKLAIAIAMLMNIVRPHELHVNSISGKDYGGGVHQSFTHGSWQYLMNWILTYVFAVFGDLQDIRSVDMGSGLNLPALIGTLVSDRFRWVGIECDNNRLLLASQIAIDAIPIVAKLLERQVRIATMKGDGTSFINLAGLHVLIIWDRAFPESVVFSTYRSCWRSYRHPFIVVQSIVYWKERSPHLEKYFHHVQVLGISKAVKFRSSSSGDSLVLALVASPKASTSTEGLDGNPPLNKFSPSVFDIFDSKFHDTNSTLWQHKELKRRILKEYEAAKRRWKGKRGITTFDKSGNMITEQLQL